MMHNNFPHSLGGSGIPDMTLRTKAASILTAAALSLLIAVPNAWSTVARHVPFDQKVDEAEAIILGRVVGTRSAFDPTGRWILTTATIQVDKSMKGAPGGTIEVTVPGGEVNGIRQETVGTPSFRQGQERVLFVRQDRVGPTVLYLDQGSYEVRKDSSGRRTIVPGSTDLVLLDDQTGKIAAAEETRTLESFEREVTLAGERMQRQRLNTAAVSRPAREERNWRTSTVEFLDENKVLMILLGIGILISLIPILRRR